MQRGLGASVFAASREEQRREVRTTRRIPGRQDEASMEKDRRKRTRYDVRYPVLIIASRSTQKGVTWNLSETGACVRCRSPLKPKDKFILDIEFPAGPLFQVPAQVVWSIEPDRLDETNPPQMGVRFLW